MPHFVYKNINKYVYIINKLLTNTPQNHVIRQNNYIQIVNFINNYSTHILFKKHTNIKTKQTSYRTYKTKNTISLINKSFTKFMNIVFFTQNTTVVVNQSFYSLYLKKKKNGTLLVVNVLKFYNNYKNVLTFIYNIFYYKLKTFFFGNIFLKKEIFSLNWLSLGKTNLKFRLNQLHIFILPLSRNEFSKKLLYLFSYHKLSNIFIFDTFYHQKTLTYLYKLPALTIGPLPISCNIKTLDVVIPVSHENIFYQLFILQVVLFQKSLSEYNKYLLYRKAWYLYRNQI